MHATKTRKSAKKKKIRTLRLVERFTESVAKSEKEGHKEYQMCAKV